MYPYFVHTNSRSTIELLKQVNINKETELTYSDHIEIN